MKPKSPKSLELAEKNKEIYEGTVDEIKEKGYILCSRCLKNDDTILKGDCLEKSKGWCTESID